MPFCEVRNNGIKLFYRTYGRGPVKVLLIIGLAGTHESWGPQIRGLTGTDAPNDGDSAAVEGGADNESGGDSSGIEVCAFDNRGMGRSSVPTKKSSYTTKIMAKDAIAIMDHLGWKEAHVFGHSMGAMIACKLAAIVPNRILSLAVLNVTGGGYECFPKLDRKTVSIAFRFLRAKTPEQRAAVDLDTHYSTEYLDEYVGSNTRRAILYQEYVKAISASGMQSPCGFEGQVNACWRHKMTPREIEMIRSTGFLVSVIHGRHDVIAQIYYARRLAEKLHPFARMVDLHGGHLVSHERTEEVNQALLELIKATEMKVSPEDWTNLPTKRPGWIRSKFTLVSNTGGVSDVSITYCMLERLHLVLLYFFSMFVLVFEYGRKAIRSLKPVKVGASLT
ncbi:putative aminoacrylate hydrolase RutD [Rhodamnia argentea]|uniref:Aminoacrylate hydrolase RutD n=1 Tax=Rhodamnia argentea TaxID=178133 RepID=A0A8B8QQ51_9MYRT|nr:putative aminoacrylate hydrolase RutD [Rhodamnia argentea]XP_030549160.1 putative aminoacrylate hydrolase RutD [Rhodamnia argentea]XP_048137650.1 putative aminoacrylate hydrolase RutD [Rhodamnia argentea]